MTRLLVTGGSSYLGRHLVPLALRAGGVDELLYTYYRNDPLALPAGRQLDLRDGAAVQALVGVFAPDAIIHTAGSNRPAETMEMVIRQGARHIAAAAQDCGARLVHLSTDVVFDGAHAPYRETDLPAPIHEYGRAKATAERIVAAYPNHVIVRTSLIYGLTSMDRGTEWVVEALCNGEPVTLFTDQIRNPVWVDSLAHACLELALGDYRGVLHVAGAQPLSRADFALRLLDWWQVQGRSALGFGTADPTRWPLDCTLDTGRARALLQTDLPGVDEVLRAAYAARV